MLKEGRLRAEKYFDQCLTALEGTRYQSEIEWQGAVSLNEVSERQFLTELAWVVINTGFREETARKLFSYIALCFFDFSSSDDIVNNESECIELARLKFNNVKKLEGIAFAARVVNEIGFEAYMKRVEKNPREVLSSLPYIGAITINHLMKNLGFAVAKNDRHLARLGKYFGFSDGLDLCSYIANKTGYRVDIIDLVLWRSSVLRIRPEGV